MDSVVEMKTILKGKLELLEQRQDEVDSQAFVFKKMITQLQKDIVVDEKKNKELQEMVNNVNNQADDLKHIYRIDNDRVLEIDNMHTDYLKRIKQDREEMQHFLDEKNVALQNHEVDVQQTLYRLMKAIERIKQLRKKLNKIDQKKRAMGENEQQLKIEFKLRKGQIECINKLSKTNLIKEFSVKIDEIERKHVNDDDQIRLEGLILITELKSDIQQCSVEPDFGSRQPQKSPSRTKTPSMAVLAKS